MKKKILVLIKSHDKRFTNYHNDLYEKLEIISRSYAKHSENVDFVYVKNDPGLEKKFKLEGDTLWIKFEENYSSAMKEKILSALYYYFNNSKELGCIQTSSAGPTMAHMDQLDNYEIKDYGYDYVFITNLSTFINLDKLEDICNSNEGVTKWSVKSIAYPFAWENVGYEFPSGAGALYSKNTIHKILSYMRNNDHSNYPYYDDIFLGYILKKLDIKFETLHRFDIDENKKWDNYLEISKKIPHTRIKIYGERELDLPFHETLLKEIYNKTVSYNS